MAWICSRAGSTKYCVPSKCHHSVPHAYNESCDHGGCGYSEENCVCVQTEPGQRLQVGQFVITRTPGKLHIRCGEGEGGEMPEDDFLKMVEQYYLAHF